MAAIKAGKILQNQHATNSEAIYALQEALYRGSEYNRLEGHSDWIHSVSFSPNGEKLASGSTDKTIKLWDVETGEEIRPLTGSNTNFQK